MRRRKLRPRGWRRSKTCKILNASRRDLRTKLSRGRHWVGSSGSDWVLVRVRFSSVPTRKTTQESKLSLISVAQITEITLIIFFMTMRYRRRLLSWLSRSCIQLTSIRSQRFLRTPTSRTFWHFSNSWIITASTTIKDTTYTANGTTHTLAHTNTNTDKWDSNKQTSTVILVRRRPPRTYVKAFLTRIATSCKKTHKTFIATMPDSIVSWWQQRKWHSIMGILILPITNSRTAVNSMVDFITWRMQTTVSTPNITKTLLIIRLFCKAWRICTKSREQVLPLILWLSSRSSETFSASVFS